MEIDSDTNRSVLFMSLRDLATRSDGDSPEPPMTPRVNGSPLFLFSKNLFIPFPEPVPFSLLNQDSERDLPA
jgi:hypothetical protein